MLRNKGALSLVVDYGGDSSDDDVPGPRVSTKRTHKSDDEDDDRHRNKKNEMLPLPSVFQKSTSVEHIDDPTLHDGRIRTFAHARGNWASYAYVPFKNTDGVKELMAFIITTLQQKLLVKATDDCHISLSRTVILRYHWIQTLTESIKASLPVCKKFMVLFDGIKIYCNEERTRTFIGLQIGSGYDSLARIVSIIDECLKEFNLATFYKDPSFHMSIAWCVGDHETELNSILPEISQKFLELTETYPQEYWYIYVESVFFKTGNKIFQFELS